MGKMVRKFDVLISCPTDIQEEINIIREVVDNFNATIGDANNAFLYTKHWSTHSYTESGGTPQDLLNNQIVLDSDAVIAVFWTRFGSPTKNFSSGTEEEIELLLNEGKQIFLFFSDISVPPSEQNFEQYEKITEFKDSYRNKGIYKTYTSIEDFKKKLTNDLTQYFLRKTMEDSNIYDSSAPKETLGLRVKCIYNKSLVDNLKFSKHNLINSNFIAKQHQEIKDIIKSVNKIEIPNIKGEIYRIESDEETPPEVEETIKHMQDRFKPATEINKSLSKLFEEREISISNFEKDLVERFLKEEDIKINTTHFFNIGNLTMRKDLFKVTFPNNSPSYSYNGTDEEKEKYELLEDLFCKLKTYNHWLNYFRSLDSKIYITLAVENFGKVYDEDVAVKLYIEKGALIKNKGIPMPNPSLLEEAIVQLNMIYEIERTHDIEEYDDGVIYSPPSYVDNTADILGYTFTRDVDSLKSDFRVTIDGIFNYEFYEDDEHDIISFNIGYIKKNTKIAFPSLLLFNNEIDEIKYEINSKYATEVFSGTLTKD